MSYVRFTSVAKVPFFYFVSHILTTARYFLGSVNVWDSLWCSWSQSGKSWFSYSLRRCNPYLHFSCGCWRTLHRSDHKLCRFVEKLFFLFAVKALLDVRPIVFFSDHLERPFVVAGKMETFCLTICKNCPNSLMQGFSLQSEVISGRRSCVRENYAFLLASIIIWASIQKMRSTWRVKCINGPSNYFVFAKALHCSCYEQSS